MRCTIKDVAKLAKTSPATVSLVLNHRPGVKESTKQRVLEAVDELNYRPNQMARSLINRRTNNIGLVVTDIHNPFYADLAYNLQKETIRNDVNLTIGISNNKVKNEKRIVESMITRGVDGILIAPARDGEGHLEHLHELKALKIPFVFVTSAYRGIEADTVMTDLEQGTYELTKHLISNGKKRISFIVESPKLLHVEERLKGFDRALSEHREDDVEGWSLEVSPEVENSIKIVDQKLWNRNPDAVITINAYTALSVMKILKDKNIVIPNEIAIASFDDFEFVSILYTPLTVVKQPIEEISKESIKLLEQRIETYEGEPSIQLLPGELVIRESTYK
ncbi:LacI family transcriptional regulator [Lachnospiraceae bacterium OttesenSCG-928-E19]|nr:LacI family transcriptional regulator [Lachnospiraceae bacterium OttesenSCG-928-E19]